MENLSPEDLEDLIKHIQKLSPEEREAAFMTEEEYESRKKDLYYFRDCYLQNILLIRSDQRLSEERTVEFLSESKKAIAKIQDRLENFLLNHVSGDELIRDNLEMAKEYERRVSKLMAIRSVKTEMSKVFEIVDRMKERAHDSRTD